ncbi:MAG: phosphoesterase [Desulfobulbus propionicus]|nr:MAG: phosphoesterase [Desulfobulbus propionicus]
MNAAAAIASLLFTKKACILVTHIHPDGDALGSVLGMASYLRERGASVLCYLEEPVPPVYRFLPGSESIICDLDQVETFAREHGGDLLTLCLDCGDYRRLGKSGTRLMMLRPFVVVDHHQGNRGFGDMSWIEPGRSSTGEMIYDLLMEQGEPLSCNTAECLFTSILTDTGGFRYEGTTEHTFAVAGELVRYGALPAKISENLYDSSTFGRLQLMQDVLSTLTVHEKGAVAVIRVTREMLDRSNTVMSDTENLVNLPRSVHSVIVAVLLKELEEGVVSVSLRAKGGCDVSEVAAAFGGGGHRNASGFRATGVTLDEVLDKLLPVLRSKVQH